MMGRDYSEEGMVGRDAREDGRRGCTTVVMQQGDTTVVTQKGLQNGSNTTNVTVLDYNVIGATYTPVVTQQGVFMHIRN